MGNRASPLRLAFLLLALGNSQELFAACGTKLKADVVAIRQSFQNKLKKFFSSQEEPPYLAIGILVELPGGERRLMVGRYFGSSHEYLLSKEGIQVLVSKDSSVDSNVEAKILWGGEIAFEKVGDDYNVEAFNQTTSTLLKPQFKAASGATVENANDPKNFEKFLEDLQGEEHPKPRVDPYVAGKPYLLGVEIPNNESIRHYMGNRCTVVFMNTSAIRTALKKDNVDVADTIEILESNHEEFGNAISNKVLGHLLKMHSKENAEIVKSIASIEKFQKISTKVLDQVKGKPYPSLKDIEPVLDEAMLTEVIDAYRKITDLIYSRKPEADSEENAFEITIP